MAAPTSDGTQENWSSKLTFILASVGFAVGLGNIWRFPYLVGENGGSAFILIYVLCAFGIGVPLVMAEWTIGRRGSGAASASGSIREVARQSGTSATWGNVGGIGVIAAFAGMLFYTTIAGWTMDYFVRAASGSFEQITADGSQSMFDNLMANPARIAFWHTVVVVLTVFINSRGLHAGIEKAVKILMPALFVSMLVLLGYSLSVGDVQATVEFLLTPDFSRVTGETILIALGQAFFSIGIAMAVMINYGSYLDKHTSIPKNAFIVVGADTLVALLAGFAIFPLVFAHQLAPDSGAGLVFQTLPIAFGDLPSGRIFASIFFFLLIAAAITSCIGQFLPAVLWVKEKFGLTHAQAAISSGFVMWFLGLGSVFSFNLLSDFHPLSFFAFFEGMTIYNSIEYVMANLLLPIVALLTSIFIGWFASNDAIREEMGLSDGLAFRTWRILMRFIVPIALAVILINGFIG